MISVVVHKSARWKAALLEASISAALGTAAPAVVLGAFNAMEMQHAWRDLLVGITILWLGALLTVAFSAFIAGAVGALLLQYFAPRVRSWRAAVLLTMVLGSVLGTMVGNVFSIRMVGIYSPMIWSHVLTGTVCGLVGGLTVFCTLKRARLLLVGGEWAAPVRP